ncbi:MAG TPA: AAA family ATPase [Candidatus Binatia bacterium]|nr:AAA family ATPase [Candidatus Binatia bacterium]
MIHEPSKVARTSMTMALRPSKRPNAELVGAAPGGSPAVGGTYTFGAFRIDLPDQRLWHGEAVVRLRPKSWDVLRYLVTHSGVLVTKDELHREVWQNAAVTEDTLTQSIRELRRCLTDDARKPRFIETVYGRGFRFISAVRAGDAVAEVAPMAAPALPVVGRGAELAELGQCLRRARAGQRQVVFLTGEAGIGKTTLVEEFVRTLSEQTDALVLHGQCVQQYGEREAYMPVLEALERGLRTPNGRALLPLFRGNAPNWFTQMPSLLPEGRVSVASGAAPLPPQNLLREIGTALELMAAQSLQVLVLEDLHWSDPATVDLLAFLAQRRDRARLLIIGTYRPSEASIVDHPIRELKQTLRLRRRCVDLALEDLTEPVVCDYLRIRFGDAVTPLAAAVHTRSDGNPLFMVAIVEELVRRELIVETDHGWSMNAAASQVDLVVPDDLREMIHLRFDSVNAGDRVVLEAASAVGGGFAAALLAPVVGGDEETVEACCQRLSRVQLFLNQAGRIEGPGGRDATRFEFRHELHRQVIYAQIPDGRRQHLHQRVGEALEGISGERATEMAPDLAFHFVQSGDATRGLKYLGLCGARAQERGAPREAIRYFRDALVQLDRLPQTEQRQRQELQLRSLLGLSLNVAHGYAAPEVRENYERARAICEALGETRQLFEVAAALCYADLIRTEPGAIQLSLGQVIGVAKRLNIPECRVRADVLRAQIEYWKGDFRVVADILGQVLHTIDDERVAFHAFTYGVVPPVVAAMHLAMASWFLGHPAHAREYARNAVARAEAHGDALSIAAALCAAAFVALACRDAARALELANRASTLCLDKGVAFFQPMSDFLRGAALAEQGNANDALRQMEHSFVAQQAGIGRLMCGVMDAYIADTHRRLGQYDEGLQRADEGIELTETTIDRMFAAELWRIKGEVLLARAQAAKSKRKPLVEEIHAAESCLLRALEIARRQHAPSLELRAAMSIARQRAAHGSPAEAHAILQPVYASFTEGLDTGDLRQAKSLLDTHAPNPVSPARRSNRAGR